MGGHWAILSQLRCGHGNDQLKSLFSGSPVDLGPPPTNANKEKSPVLQELRRLAFKRVPDELEDPADDKERDSIHPKPMSKKSDYEHSKGDQDQRNAAGMAQAVDRVLVASRILRDPLLVAESTEHLANDTPEKPPYKIRFRW